MAKNQLLKLVQDKIASDCGYRRLVGELWTSQQRQMHSLHYVVNSRDSFKPELPDYCIKRYSDKGSVVLDPFCGFGATLLQANLMGRIAWGSDVNPLALLLTSAKTAPAGLDEVVLSLNQVDYQRPVNLSGYTQELAAFYHPDTFRELVNLRSFIRQNDDRVNRFIAFLAVSRLHGHSPGYFSAYSFPQVSISPQRQALINLQRRQQPEHRAVAPRIIKKAAQSLRDGLSSEFFSCSANNRLFLSDARKMTWVRANSVDLVLTSPPSPGSTAQLGELWLEYWFTGVDPQTFASRLLLCRNIEMWRAFMDQTLAEMLRVLKPKSFAVIEVGDIIRDNQIISLDETAAELAEDTYLPDKRFVVEEVLVNKQSCAEISTSLKATKGAKAHGNRLLVLKCVARQRRSSRSL